MRATPEVCVPARSFSVPATRRPVAKCWDELQELCALCQEGKLYAVEQWIADGKPIQLELPSQRPPRRHHTPLQIAAEKGFHSLAELLLRNGYDPNGDYFGCLDAPVTARNPSMVELLFTFGTDPAQVEFDEVLESYNRRIMDLFVAAGVDPCAGNAVANALRRKTKPLLGFIKTHKERFPALQWQIDIALRQFVQDGDEKGVSLLLWLGANPCALVPITKWEEEDEELYECALATAIRRRNEKILQRLLKTPMPPDRATYLLQTAASSCRPDVARKLLELGADPNGTAESSDVLEVAVLAVCDEWRRSEERDKRGLDTIRLLAAAGAKWSLNEKQLASIRRRLLDAEATTVIGVVGIFREFQVLTDDQLHELIRTDGMKRRLRGISRASLRRFDAVAQPAPVYHLPASADTTTRRGYWKRHWWQW